MHTINFSTRKSADIATLTSLRVKLFCLQLELVLLTILTHMMADEFNFPWSKIGNYIAEADAD